MGSVEKFYFNHNPMKKELILNLEVALNQDFVILKICFLRHFGEIFNLCNRTKNFIYLVPAE